MATGIHIPWPCANPGSWAGVWLEAVGHRDCTRYNTLEDPDFFCTHLIVKGKLRFQAGLGVDVVLGPDDLFSFWHHIPFRLTPHGPHKGEDIEMDWVRLRGPLARDFMRTLGTTEDRPWARAFNPKESRSLMLDLQTLARAYTPQADFVAISMLHRLAAACVDHGPAPALNRPLAERVREAMEQHVDSDMNVTDYARAFRISRSKLFLKLKEAYGKSPIELLEEIRIHRAKSLLENTAMSVTEVAYASGYRDPLYFSRQFRRHAGLPPSQFRKAK